MIDQAASPLDALEGSGISLDPTQPVGIHFQRVSFAYPTDPSLETADPIPVSYVLRDFSLRIPAGKMVSNPLLNTISLYKILFNVCHVYMYSALNAPPLTCEHMVSISGGICGPEWLWKEHFTGSYGTFLRS